MLLATRRGADHHGQRQLLSIKYAVFQLGISRTKIYTMINEGALEVRRIGRHTLVTQASIARYTADGV